VLRGLLCVALVGCDGLATNDYVGESLFTLEGTFATTTNAPEDPLGGVALLWQDPAGPDGPGVASTTVPVAIQFPASFEVDIPVPPPAAARFSFEPGIDIAEAYVFVVANTGSDHVTPLGGERTHAVVWASADVPTGSLAADYLGGPVSAGYHLRTFVPIATVGAAQAQMIERCAGDKRACEVRRAYQLSVSGDHDRLSVAVSP
jgi:hypothetical protein